MANELNAEIKILKDKISKYEDTLNRIRNIISISNHAIQEDVLKYKMICETLEESEV